MLYRRWLFYLGMLLGIAIAVWIALDPRFGSESADRIRRGGLFLQLLGVLTIGAGIYRILRGSSYTLREIFAAGEVKESVTVSGSVKIGSPIVSASGHVSQADVPVEERLETLEKRQVKLFSDLGRAEQELKKEITDVREELERERNRRERTAERLREEREKALTSNLDLEVVGFMWVFAGIAMRLFFV